VAKGGGFALTAVSWTCHITKANPFIHGMIIKFKRKNIPALVLILEVVLHHEQFDEKHYLLVVCSFFCGLSAYESEETTLFLGPGIYASTRPDAVQRSLFFFV